MRSYADTTRVASSIGLSLSPRVDRYARITVRQCRYSVPARLIGRRVRVSLRASELVVFDGRREVARHDRLVRRGGQSICLDHYLEILTHKPGALAGSTRWRRPGPGPCSPTPTSGSGPGLGPRTATGRAPGC